MPLITPNVENILVSYIPVKTWGLNCVYHQTGIVDNHIHLLATIPPNMDISNFVKKIKGSSAHSVNKSILDLDYQFQWQSGYGVVSFDKKALPNIKRYVANQKEHHKDNTLIEILEKT